MDFGCRAMSVSARNLDTVLTASNCIIMSLVVVKISLPYSTHYHLSVRAHVVVVYGRVSWPGALLIKPPNLIPDEDYAPLLLSGPGSVH